LVADGRALRFGVAAVGVRWPAGWVAGWVAGWLAGWVAGWVAGRPATYGDQS
jgi:hypothetical protein